MRSKALVMRFDDPQENQPPKPFVFLNHLHWQHRTPLGDNVLGRLGEERERSGKKNRDGGQLCHLPQGD